MRIKTGFYVSIVCSFLAIGLSAIAADTNLKEIMQGLRDDTVQIADGLLVDDLNMVADAALRIANHASIPPAQVQLVAAELGTEMAAFKQLDVSVHDLSVSVAAAAAANDREKAIADYQNMLGQCLACHAGYRVRVGAVLGGVQATTEP
jgi:cytochrome c556